MAKICYIDKRFNASSEAIIQKANEIIEEYGQQGMSLTLRQLYYQFVARDVFNNYQNNYRRLGSIINDARLAGLVDWNAIEDRTRNLRGNPHRRSPKDVLDGLHWGFHLDHWKGQEFRVEVWIEKEALIGVISSICSQLDVDYFACKGYVSQSEQWRTAQRHQFALERGISPVIIHLGDHDPSGIDMTRDNQDRLRLFGSNIHVERIALNMDQVDKYNPPPNPAKVTDSRFDDYYEKYGRSSWELDALDPTVMRDLIQEKVEEYRDDEKYQAVLAKEKEYKETLKEISEKWDYVDWSNVYV